MFMVQNFKSIKRYRVEIVSGIYYPSRTTLTLYAYTNVFLETVAYYIHRSAP